MFDERLTRRFMFVAISRYARPAIRSGAVVAVLSSAILAAIGSTSEARIFRLFDFVWELESRQGNDTHVAAPSLQKLSEEDLRGEIKELQPGIRPFYDRDDRADFYRMDPDIKSIAAASPALIRIGKLSFGAGGKAELKSRSLAQAKNLCPGETFGHQQTASFCSGVLIAKDKVLTAAHCVRDLSKSRNVPFARNIFFVFGYHVFAPNEVGNTRFRKRTQVYRGLKVLAGSSPEENDWAVVKLRRSVNKNVARPIVKWREAELVEKDRLFSLGYPSGLPSKYGPNAMVRAVKGEEMIVANLDVFSGNSGGGVFDEDNNLAGIVIAGSPDYELKPGQDCRITKNCPTTGCDGEYVLRISAVNFKK